MSSNHITKNPIPQNEMEDICQRLFGCRYEDTPNDRLQELADYLAVTYRQNIWLGRRDEDGNVFHVWAKQPKGEDVS